MIKKIYRFFQGYLEIEIRGNALERLINQINNLEIILWDLRRIKKDFYQAKLYSGDFNRLRPILRKRHCRVRIKDKRGFPFLLKAVYSRKFLVVGIILFLCIFYFGSSFLFFIRIDGLEKIGEERIRDILSQSGVKRGILKKEINIESLKKRLLKEEPRIAWVNVSWKGTQLYVEIVEKKIVEETSGGDLVAAKDGIISEIIVLKGMPVVREGDTVTAGQPLIVAKDEEKARGIIRAYVWYEDVGVVKLSQKEIYWTGRKKTYWGFRVGQGIIWLPPYQKYFQNYQRRREIKTLLKWRNIGFPIELIKEEHKEIELIRKRYTRKTAWFLAKEKALQQIFSQISPGAIILDIQIEELNQKDSSVVKLRVLVKTLEDIGKLKN